MVNPLYFKCGRKPIAQSGSEMHSLVNLSFILCWFSDIRFAESEVHLYIFLHLPAPLSQSSPLKLGEPKA